MVLPAVIRSVPVPTDQFGLSTDSAFQRWRAAIQKQAFARGKTYGFRYIDYYSTRTVTSGCLAGADRACGFSTKDPSLAQLL